MKCNYSFFYSYIYYVEFNKDNEKERDIYIRTE